MPPNYGAAYTDGFRKAFAEVARAQGATPVPFFLEGIAADPKQFLDDGIHPSRAAQGRLLDAVWPVLHPVIAP
jgi:acyl-CoA thioesterase-1